MTAESPVTAVPPLALRTSGRHLGQYLAEDPELERRFMDNSDQVRAGWLLGWVVDVDVGWSGLVGSCWLGCWLVDAD